MTRGAPPPGWPEAIAFAAAWDRSVTRAPDDAFLVFEAADGTATTWTYSEFDHVVDRCAALLAERRVGSNDAVHLALGNSPAFLAIWLATSRIGGWIVPSDPMATEAELAGHLRRTAPLVGFCASSRAATYRAAATDVVPVVEIDEADVALDVFGTEAFGARPAVPLRHRAAVMFTSGTTGVPKGVEITQANYAFTGMTMAEACSLRAGHRQLVVLPMFHANAQFYSVASAIWAGASVALMHTFSASRFLTQAATHRATHASLFAAPIRMILARSEPPPAPVGLQHCWYAMNITDNQYEHLAGWLGCRPRQLYGMTETLPAVLTEPAEDPIASSIGRPTGSCLVDIDRTDPASADADEGEIIVGGERGITVFNAYLDDPATTQASFTTDADGTSWFHTGDRATRTADGRFVFAGRRSDVLKVGGENVSTVEVEQVVGAFVGVLEVAVVGRPDEVLDEVPVAYVVADDPAAPPSAEALNEWCAQRLAKPKRPRAFVFVHELPRTSVGKIRKFVLRTEQESTT